MPYYDYEGREKTGKLIKSQAFALNKQELIKLLHGQGLLIISAKEATAIEEKYRKRLHRRATTGDLVLLAKQFAILLENGVAMIDAFDVMLKQMESSDLINALREIKKDVEGGDTLRDAIAKHPRIFGSFWHDMIDAGEISGQLPFVMRQIVVFLQSREDLKKKTINAFLYPALLLTLALFTILVFVFRVVPIFEELFSTFGGKLPVFTSVIISGSNFARRYFIVVAIVAGILGFIVKRALSTKPGRRLYETMLLNTPVAGNLFLALSIEKFASTLGVLLKSGIPIIRALEVAVKTSQSLIFSERVEEAKVKVMGGLPFSEALLQTSIFPPLAVQLVLVAEKTGNFSGMLEEISKYYNDIIDVAVTRFTTLIGPIVLIFMAFVIGALIIAMFLPIFKFASLG